MLRLRIFTAIILACVLLLGLFALEPRWTVPAFGAVFAVGAWEWASFGGLRRPAARLGYAAAIVALLYLGWRLSGDAERLQIVLGIACAWWVLAFAWLLLAPERHQPRLTLLCGVPVLVPAFLALARLDIAHQGPARGPTVVLWLVFLVIAADIGA